MKLTIIRGLPGSGKSTLAKKLLENQEASHYEADMFFEEDGFYNFRPELLGAAHRWCQKMTFDDLSMGRDVIVSNTFTTNKEMRPYLDYAKEFSHEVEIIECLEQYGSVHNVPEKTMERMKARWEKCDE